MTICMYICISSKTLNHVETRTLETKTGPEAQGFWAFVLGFRSLGQSLTCLGAWTFRARFWGLAPCKKKQEQLIQPKFFHGGFRRRLLPSPFGCDGVSMHGRPRSSESLCSNAKEKAQSCHERLCLPSLRNCHTRDPITKACS